MESRDRLLGAVRGYDGRDVEPLAEAYRAFASADRFADEVLNLCASANALEGEAATWLLKTFMDDGGRLTPAQTHQLVDTICTFESWQAQLHVCQCAGRLEIEPADADFLIHWLTPLLSSKRPFLRAWSLDALCAIAEQHTSYREMFSSALSVATSDDAASVRARARKLVARHK